MAAIICSDETVIDFCCDDLNEVNQVVREHCARLNLPMPYMHFDSVIGWMYLALCGLSDGHLDRVLGRGEASARAAEVLSRVGALGSFDSLGVDLHKTRMCPYASSFYVGRDRVGGRLRHPQPEAVQTYRDFAVAFMEHCWARVQAGDGLPLFSIVPEFLVDHRGLWHHSVP